MLLEILRPIFEHDYEIVKNQNIDQRMYPTKCNKLVADDITKVIDFLASKTVKKSMNHPILTSMPCFLLLRLPSQRTFK